MPKELTLSQGYVAIVDDEDYEQLSTWKWSLHTNPSGTMYARRRGWDGAKLCWIWMHRAVTQCPIGMDVDHINHNGLDNRKENLRVCSRSQNHQNKRKQRKYKGSQYKGVYPYNKTSFWIAQVENKKLGIYRTELDAAIAYDLAALELFGVYALLNFPSHDYTETKAPESIRLKSGKTSPYRGVCFHAAAKKYVATLRHQGQNHYLGLYETAEEAALAYDTKAKELCGCGAKLNFPNEVKP